MKSKPSLTIDLLLREANVFAVMESSHNEPTLFGVTDGKRVGTYLEHKFQDLLSEKYHYTRGNSAQGIDFPELGVDIKVTSIEQPQSSCPYKSARQKIYGLGYSLLVFVYNKIDDKQSETGRLDILHAIFVEAEKTADFQMTTGLHAIIDNQGNHDDVIAFFEDKRLPVDEIEAGNLAEEVLNHPPRIGYLTISNALQWRLQYRRIIDKAGQVDGIVKVK